MIVPLGVLAIVLSGCAAQPTPIEQEETIENSQPVDASTKVPVEQSPSGAASTPAQSVGELREPEIVEYAVPNGARPHDVAPAPDGICRQQDRTPPDADRCFIALRIAVRMDNAS